MPCGTPTPCPQGKEACSQGGHRALERNSGPTWCWIWAGSRWVAFWSRPQAGHRGPIVAGPSQARPSRSAIAMEFREVSSRQGSPRPWPGLPGGGAAPQGQAGRLVPMVQTDRQRRLGWGQGCQAGRTDRHHPDTAGRDSIGHDDSLGTGEVPGLGHRKPRGAVLTVAV